MFLSYKNVGSRESEVGRILFLGHQLWIFSKKGIECPIAYTTGTLYPSTPINDKPTLFDMNNLFIF